MGMLIKFHCDYCMDKGCTGQCTLVIQDLAKRRDERSKVIAEVEKIILRTAKANPESEEILKKLLITIKDIT